MEYYSVLALVLLITAVIFAAYREYSVSLEKQIAVYNSNLLTITQWAQSTIEKYECFIESGSNEPKNSALYKGFHKEIKTIQPIKNPVLQALLYELVFTGERLGISIDISVTPANSDHESSRDINLNNYDLYSIINDFVVSAVLEANSQPKKLIRVDIVHHITQNSDNDIKGDFSFYIQTHIGQAPVEASYGETDLGFDLTSPGFKIKKDAIIQQMRKNRNITISLTKTDRFVQALTVAGAV